MLRKFVLLLNLCSIVALGGEPGFSSGRFHVTPNGTICFDKISFQLKHADGSWMWSTVNAKELRDAAYRKTNREYTIEGIWHVRGGDFVMKEKINAASAEKLDVTLDFSAVKNAVLCKMIGLAARIPHNDLIRRGIIVNGKSFRFPEKFDRSQAWFFCKRGKNTILIPLENGSLKLTTDASLLIQDNRISGRPEWEIRIRNEQDNEPLSKESFQISLEYIPAAMDPQVLSAKNQIGFRTYTQKVIMEFASSSDAQKAQLIPADLPENYTIAVTSRWDDSNPQHLITLNLLKKNGMTGNFYLTDTPTDLMKRLVDNGGAIGLHTVNHPILTLYAPNQMFYQYMRNRIDLEVGSKSCINSQVLPYCVWLCTDRRIVESLGFAMRAAEVIESPDVMICSPKDLPKLGYKPESMAYAWLLRPGDQVPSFQKFEMQLKKHLNNREGLARNPAISMSMHSWHTKDGLKKLDKIFQHLSGHMDWWYCTQTQYGAYRYEAKNCTIEKKQTDKKVIFTITRFEPSEIACAQSLWFHIGTVPKKITGALVHGKKIELAHASGKRLPVRFGKMENGKSVEFPELELVLIPAGALGWSAILTNKGKETLKNCYFTFSFSAEWATPTMRKDVAEILPGKRITATVKQAFRQKDLFYRSGVPYTAVRVDFTMDDTRCRLYADWNGKAVIDQTSAQVLSIAGIVPEKLNPAEVSRPEYKMEMPDQKKIKRDPNAAENVILAWKSSELKNKQLFVALDFELAEAVREISSSNIFSGTVWINGKKFNKTAKIAIPAGKNRLLLITEGQTLNTRLSIPGVKRWISPLQK